MTALKTQTLGCYQGRSFLSFFPIPLCHQNLHSLLFTGNKAWSNWHFNTACRKVSIRDPQLFC